jgi:S-formylglutathione hydrolase FrmB
MPIGQMTFHSAALTRDVTFNVYLPDPSRFEQERFPALLLLHGRNGSYQDWMTLARLPVRLYDLPLIGVVPDGAGAASGWSNWLVPSDRFEDFVIRDLIPACESFFPIEPGRWAIGGNSMGGYGALLLGLKHPDRFRSIYAHSSVVFSPERIRELRPSLTAAEVDDADLRTHAARLAGDPNRPVLGFDCGRGDHLIAHSRSFHTHLDAIGYPHTYEEPAGGHTWLYWDERLPHALEQHMVALSNGDGTATV